MITSDVPCNGCTLCCVCDAVLLLPAEVPFFDNEPHAWFPGKRMLAHQEDGRCIYLTASGCAVHDRKPSRCREMDCRNIATLTFKEARTLSLQGRITISLWQKGKEMQSKCRSGKAG